MEFRIFFGAHRAGHEHLLAQLEANRNLLDANGILLPTPEKMEAAVWPAIRAIRNNNADESTLPRMVQELTGGQKYRSVLIARPSISGSPLRPIKDDIIYPRGSATMAHLLRLIGQDDVRLFCAVRNPASLLQSCYHLAYENDAMLTFEDFYKVSDPFALRWSEYLHRIQGRENPLPLTAWTYEDYPYMWRSVAQAFAGLPNKEDLVAAQAPFDTGISLQGLTLMQEYLKKHPAETGAKRNQIVAKFEERFPIVGVDSIPDVWPEELTEAFSNSYDDDLYYIERMENVRLIKRPNWA